RESDGQAKHSVSEPKPHMRSITSENGPTGVLTIARAVCQRCWIRICLPIPSDEDSPFSGCTGALLSGETTSNVYAGDAIIAYRSETVSLWPPRQSTRGVEIMMKPGSKRR